MSQLPKKLKLLFSALLIFISSLLVVYLVIYFSSLIFEKVFIKPTNVVYGVTFSPLAAEELGLDWKTVYLAVLKDLDVKYLRLPSYWSTNERLPGEYDFSQTDFMIDEAKKSGAKVILTVGIKQPRWPECHTPNWVNTVSIEERQGYALKYIAETVNRYKNNSAVVAWQVENEPLLYFFASHCDAPDRNFLKKEVVLVRSLSKLPIIVSDSGELSVWGEQMQLSDIFGTTLYRTVWNPVLGYTTYPVPPGFYSLKSKIFKSLFAPNNQKTIIVELQAEPWFPENNALAVPINDQEEIFPMSQFQRNVSFAKKTGFDEILLWGVEWWYFMKQNGQSQYWDYAKTLF